MNQRTRLRISRIISPVIITALKVHTSITGTERSRIIVVNEEEKILLVRGMVGSKWTLPGGGIEKNESPLLAAKRELFEETGIEVDQAIIKKVGTIEGKTSPVNYRAHIFFVRVNKDVLPKHPHNQREIIEIGWFDPKKLPSDLSAIARTSLGLLHKHL